MADAHPITLDSRASAPASIPGVAGILAYLVRAADDHGLQSRWPFENGAQGYRSQYGRYDIAETLRRCSRRRSDRWSSRWCSERCSPSPPAGCRRAGLPADHTDPAYRHARGGERRGLGLPASPGRLPEAAPQAAVVERLGHRPIDVYTVPWIILLTAFGLTSFALSLRQCRACRTSVPSISRPRRSADPSHALACSSGSSCPCCARH